MKLNASEETERCERAITSPARTALAVAIAIVLLLPISSILSVNAEGAITNKVVSGYVTNTLGNTVGGASVLVEIWGGSWPSQDFFRISSTTSTNPLGYYEVTINGNYWDPHNTIKVIVTVGPAQSTQMAEADDQTYQTVNVIIDLTIPEFSGTLIPSAVAVGAMALMCGVLARRRRR